MKALTFSPRFSNAGTQKVVLESVAGVGETLNYILRVENDGSAAATQTRIRDTLPAGVTYTAGTTTNTCGVNSNDVAGTSPVLRAQGLNVTAWSYLDDFSIGIQACREHVPDVHVLADAFAPELDALLDAAATRRDPAL